MGRDARPLSAADRSRAVRPRSRRAARSKRRAPLPARPRPRAPARPRTATLSSRMAGTGFSTPRCSGSPIRRRSRRGWSPSRASSSTACSSGSQARLFSPEARAFASSSGPEIIDSHRPKRSIVMIAKLKPPASGRCRARRVSCARIVAVVGSAVPAERAAEPSANALEMAREIIDLKNATMPVRADGSGGDRARQKHAAADQPDAAEGPRRGGRNLRKVYAPRTADLLTDIAVGLCVALHRSGAQGAARLLQDADRQEGHRRGAAGVRRRAWRTARTGRTSFGEEVLARFRAEMKKRGHDL